MFILVARCAGLRQKLWNIYFRLLCGSCFVGFSGVRACGPGFARLTFPLFLKNLLAIVRNPSQVMEIVAVLWRIWKSRNWVVFEGKQFGIPALLRQYHQQVREWDSLPREVEGFSPVRVTSDGPPGSQNHLICRWDGAVRLVSHSAGGMVLLSPDGAVVAARGVVFPEVDEPMLVEVLALREAILWCRGRGCVLVHFEGDAKVVVDILLLAQGSDSTASAIFREVLLYLAENVGFSVRFVGRSINRVAHLVVARKALSLYPIASRSFDFVAWLRQTV
ncbi:unnamed protein product [Linum trigynum]|uniref:RNase H type-1 domain-containing protein n=1 Tax=Linum trigynum TaxID=586398 RepID=A0AAV2CRT5_9ROSI